MVAVADPVAGRADMTLPRAAYVDPAVFADDLTRVFYRGWLFAGHACEIPEVGDFFAFGVGGESVVVVRDTSGEIVAHHNVCRHRGSRIVSEPCGNARVLVCPYHQWTYGLDGRLKAARLMGEGFDVGDYRLRPAAVRDLAGLLFVCLDPDPPDFDAALAAVAPQLRPHGLDRAKIAGRHRYTVRANWKLLVENNRECYHCRGSHPEFCLSNFDLGVNGDTRRNATYDAVLAREQAHWTAAGLAPREVNFPGGSWYRAARLPLKDGFVTESLDGRLLAPLMGDLADARTGSLRLVTLPNFWGHANCDYAMTTRLTPVGPALTEVDVCFLVHADAVEGVDYDPQALAAVWKATSEQDWHLCENNQAGVASLAYEPGPYSPVMENGITAFVDWYRAHLS